MTGGATIALLLAAAAPVAADRQTHAVTFTATATGVEKGTPVEFVFTGKDTDRDYEALYVLDASIDDFARAFDEAGIPCGRSVDPAACVFWPSGVGLTLSPALDTLLASRQNGKDIPFERLVYTGGQRAIDGRPVAATNMPAAVFSTYDLSQSLIQFDGAFAQGEVYGRYQPLQTTKKGSRATFRLAWDGRDEPKRLTVDFTPGHVKDEFARLKKASEQGPVEVLARFSPELTVREAQSAAQALAVVDSPRFKINGFDRLFYRAFLPLEKWRDRRERLVQPIEVRCRADGSFLVSVIDEDWSGEGECPKMTVTEKPMKDADEVGRFISTEKNDSGTVLVFVSADAKLACLYDLVGKVTRRVANWYIYID